MSSVLFPEDVSEEVVVKTIADLASADSDSALAELGSFLSHDYVWFGDNNLPVIRYACLGVLQKGARGVRLLRDRVLDVSYVPDSLAAANMLEYLWYASHGRFPPAGYFKTDLIPPLNSPLSDETIQASKRSFHEIAEEAQINQAVFERIFFFQYQATLSMALVEDEASEEEKKVTNDTLRSVVFELYAEPAIKITRRLIDEFEELIRGERREEVYQQFLTKHPVFIDPLASDVIPKQKLGVEHVTDFVVRRLDNEYILVEIEKPHDAIFTSAADFTAKFTHAYGQIIDFQEWVDAHGEYARSLMPGISSPRGMLVIGNKGGLTAAQLAKLKRFNVNSKAVEVVTYDELITKTINLYENIRKHTASPSDNSTESMNAEEKRSNR